MLPHSMKLPSLWSMGPSQKESWYHLGFHLLAYEDESHWDPLLPRILGNRAVPLLTTCRLVFWTAAQVAVADFHGGLITGRAGDPGDGG